MEDKENHVNTINASKMMKDITNTVITRKDVILGSTDLKTENAKMRKALQEKEKELVLLNRQMLLQADTIKDLQNKQDKAKHSELEAKKKLSSNLTSFRRQSIDLKRINDNIQTVLKRDEDKIRRSKLERKELEDEINRMEEEFEHSISILQEEMKTEKDKFDELNEQKDKEHSDAIYNRTVEFESTLNEAKKQSSLIQQEFEGEKEKMVRMLKSIQDELQSEKDRMNIEKCKLEDIIMLKEKQHNEEIIRLSMQLKAEKEQMEDMMTSKEQQYIDDSSAKTSQYFESILKFSSQLTELNNKLISLVSDNNTLKATNETLNDDIEKMTLSLESKDNEIRELFNLNDKLQSNLKKSENEIARRTESFNQIRSNLYEAESKITIAQKSHKSKMEKQIEEYDEKISDLVNENNLEKAELKEKNSALSEELQCAITEMNRMAEEHHIQSLVVAGLSNDLQAAIGREKDYKATIIELEIQNKGLLDDIANKDKNYETLLEEASVIENSLMAAKQEYDELFICNENTVNQLNDAVARCQVLENEIAQHLEVINRLNEEIRIISQTVIDHEATIATINITHEAAIATMNAKYSELEVNTEIELSALRDNLHMLKEQAEVSLDATEFKKLKDDNTTKDKEIKILQGKLLQLQNHFNAFKQHSENTQILAVSLKNESNVYKGDLEVVRRELKSLKEERNSIVDSLNHQLKQSKEEMTDKTKKYEAMANEKIQTSNSLTNLQNNFNESIAAKDREILNLKGSHDDILEQIAKKDKIIEFLQTHVANNCNEAVTALEHQVKLYKAELDQIQGHANGKQKIMYVSALKQQINDLLEENSKLRKKVISVDGL